MKSKAGRRTAPAGRPGLCAFAWGGELWTRKIGCGGRSRTCRLSWLMRPRSRPCSIPAPGHAWLRRRDSNSHQLVYKTSALSAVELRRKILVEWERLELSPNSLQDCRSAELSYPPEINPRKSGRGGGTRTRALSLMRRMLCPLSYPAQCNLLAGLAGLEPASARLEDERSCPSELQTLCE